LFFPKTLYKTALFSLPIFKLVAKYHTKKIFEIKHFDYFL